MRSTRAGKKRNKKMYLMNIVVAFLILIPMAAIVSSLALHYAVSDDELIQDAAAIFAPKDTEKTEKEAFKYKLDISAKQLYRVEMQRFERFEDAEAMLTELKKKKLNAFIIKEQGYLVAYGEFTNKSQADTAAKFLKRKSIDAAVNLIEMKGINIDYNDVDGNLIDLASATDSVVMEILQEKSGLSLESLYSDKEMKEASLKAILDKEGMLIKYLNYLKDLKTSEANADYKTRLEAFIKELLVDSIQGEASYDYYSLQNSLMNQGEALRKFYENHAL